MSSNDVVKCVAKKLKYYFEVKRLEDGFDLSDVHQPQLDHPPLKVRPAHRNDGLHDRALKHYFSQPEVRVQLTHLNGQNARGSLNGRKELHVRKLLDNYMNHYSLQRNPLPSCYHLYTSKGCPLKAEGVLRRRKKQKKNIIGGYPLLRTVPEQHISKGEATRLVNSATKILVASSRYGLAEHLMMLDHIGANKAYDDFYVDRPLNRTPAPPRPRSPTPSQSTTATSTTASSEKRPRSAKYQSRTVINVPERRQQEEVAVIRSTQTAADYDVGRETDRQAIENFDKLEEEVKDGPWCEYQVYVRTGKVLGASTKAPIKLIMYGEKGRTKEFILSDSKSHKIPFQKGNEDVFLLPAHHIGRMRKIQIGHDRPELSFAWFLERVTIFDMHARRIFQFPCDRWLSGQDGDRRTYRMLPVDRETDFIDALDESMKKSPRNEESESEAEGSHSKENQIYGKDRKGNYSTKANPSYFTDSDTDSDSSSGSSTVSASSESSQAKIPVNVNGSTPRQKKKYVKDDYDEKVKTGTVITLHSGPEAKKVDEIYMDPRGKDAKPATEYVEGYKAALNASEEERKKQLERGREMERSMLQGKSIHEAVRDGDTERVKDLLHHFPEMRDFRDESSWTPLHLAAARGNIEPLRWLVTSDADINAETSTGYNAMHIAAMNGHVNSMMFLQAMGSSIFGLTAEKQSALHLAAKSGHLECVKWLVANRASLVAEDNYGRTPYKLAKEFSHVACADFLGVCMRELANPRSTFAQMHGRRLSGSNLPPIEEDTGSASSGNQWKDDVEIKGGNASDSEDENMNRKRSAAHEKELEQKRKVYDQQHQRMEEKGVSFLDSIRQEAND